MRWVAVLALAMLLGGCAVVGPVRGPVAGGAVPGVEGAPPFPECMVDEFAFVGETSLAAIGLDQFAGPQEANRVAMIWVTAGPVEGVQAPAPTPLPANGKGFAEPMGRMVCVQWPDGSGMSAPVDPAWQPPTDSQTVSADEPAAPIPLGLLALLVGAALLVGVSFVAFRGETA